MGGSRNSALGGRAGSGGRARGAASGVFRISERENNPFPSLPFPSPCPSTSLSPPLSLPFLLPFSSPLSP